jgi:hypothetical protein
MHAMMVMGGRSRTEGETDEEGLGKMELLFSLGKSIGRGVEEQDGVKEVSV